MFPSILVRLTHLTILLSTLVAGPDEVPDVREVLDEALEAANTDVGALRAIPRALARAGDVEAALRVARSMVTSASEVQEVAIAQAKAGDLKGALQTADSIGNDSVRNGTLAQLAGLQAERGDIRGARATVEKLSDPRNKRYALAPIASAQAKSGQIEAALETAKDIPDRGNFGLPDIALAQAKAGQLDAALREAATVQPDYYKAEVLAEIAELRVKAGDTVSAKRVLKQALETLGTNLSTRNHGSAATRIAVVQMKLGDRETARKTFAQARAAINERNLGRVIWEQAKAGDLEEALKIARSMNLAHGLLLIAGFQAESGDLPGALATAESIEYLEMRSTALALVAAAQRKAGLLVDAKVGFQRALEAAHNLAKPPPGIGDPTVRPVFEIAYQQAKCGDAQTAVEWARKEETSSRRSRALLGAALGMLDRKEAER
jgi:tetratricopeptide (TPR) repeat protein